MPYPPRPNGNANHARWFLHHPLDKIKYIPDVPNPSVMLEPNGYATANPQAALVTLSPGKPAIAATGGLEEVPAVPASRYQDMIPLLISLEQVGLTLDFRNMMVEQKVPQATIDTFLDLTQPHITTSMRATKVVEIFAKNEPLGRSLKEYLTLWDNKIRDEAKLPAFFDEIASVAKNHAASNTMLQEGRNTLKKLANIFGRKITASCTGGEIDRIEQERREVSQKGWDDTMEIMGKQYLNIADEANKLVAKITKERGGR
jgi:hypothetical protein